MRISSIAFVLPTRRASRCVPANPGMSPRLISGCPNRARVGGDAQRARHGELAATAEREAVDGGDDRLAELLDEIEDVLARAAHAAARLGCVARKLVDVGARHKRLVAAPVTMTQRMDSSC